MEFLWFSSLNGWGVVQDVHWLVSVESDYCLCFAHIFVGRMAHWMVVESAPQLRCIQSIVSSWTLAAVDEKELPPSMLQAVSNTRL